MYLASFLWKTLYFQYRHCCHRHRGNVRDSVVLPKTVRHHQFCELRASKIGKLSRNTTKVASNVIYMLSNFPAHSINDINRHFILPSASAQQKFLEKKVKKSRKLAQFGLDIRCRDFYATGVSTQKVLKTCLYLAWFLWKTLYFVIFAYIVAISIVFFSIFIPSGI